MKPTVYITEPEAIDVSLVRNELEAADYELFEGNSEFTGTLPENVTALFVRSGTQVTASVKTIFPNLTSIIRAGTGLDAIDVEFCKANGIAIFSAPGANARAVSEYTVMMMLVALRRFNALTAADVSSWNRFKFRGRSLQDQTIGIVGFGAVGRLVYENLRGFDCEGFYAYDPYLTQEQVPEDVQLVALEDIITNADIITIHVPLTDETTHLFGQDAFERMKPGAVLINVSRGGIVDEHAAVAATERGIIYVADVVENEPHVNEQLLGKDTIIVTPHIASLTDAAEVAMVTDAVTHFLNGRPTIAPTSHS